MHRHPHPTFGLHPNANLAFSHLQALIPTVPMAKRARNEVHPHVEEELENELTNWTKPIRVRKRVS